MAKTRATATRPDSYRELSGLRQLHIIRHAQTLMAHELAPQAGLGSAER